MSDMSTPSFQPLRLSDDSPVPNFEPRSYVQMGETVAASDLDTQPNTRSRSAVAVADENMPGSQASPSADESQEIYLLSELIRQAAHLHSRLRTEGSAQLSLAQKVVIQCAVVACRQLTNDLTNLLGGQQVVETDIVPLATPVKPAAQKRRRSPQRRAQKQS